MKYSSDQTKGPVSTGALATHLYLGRVAIFETADLNNGAVVLYQVTLSNIKVLNSNIICICLPVDRIHVSLTTAMFVPHMRVLEVLYVARHSTYERF